MFYNNVLNLLKNTAILYFSVVLCSERTYIFLMRKNLSIDGKRVRALVNASEISREKVVVLVQDSGYQFSITGLDKIFRNELPKKDTESILGIIAEACRCNVSDFAESDSKSA